MRDAFLRNAAKKAIATAQLFDPSRLVLADRWAPQPGPVALVAVYRHRHAARLHQLLQGLGPDATVRLWCLDDPADSLRSWTVGQGPGTRFELLNRLIEGVPAAQRRGGLIVSDDDYSFTVGDLGQLVAAGPLLGLDLWQPAHNRTSFANFSFLRRRAGVVARRTTFVEQGPVLVLSPRAQQVLLPLPQDIGMGWGVEIGWWQDALRTGLQFGIVDALAIRHLPPTGGYNRDAEAAQLESKLVEAGLERIEDLQQVQSRVGVWEAHRLRRAQDPRTANRP